MRTAAAAAAMQGQALAAVTVTQAQREAAHNRAALAAPWSVTAVAGV